MTEAATREALEKVANALDSVAQAQVQIAQVLAYIPASQIGETGITAKERVEKLSSEIGRTAKEIRSILG